jgi:hypothetical protein
MFTGPPLPLPSDLPLQWLAGHTCSGWVLGAWTREPIHTLEIHCPTGGRVLVSADLGFLLGRCSRVAVREGREVVVLEADLLIQWRALQVVTATPYLPGLERLSAIFHRARFDSNGFLVPIANRSPEEVLAECIAVGMQISGSRIVYTVPCTNG